MKNFYFHNSTKVYFGKDEVDKVGKLSKEFGNNVLLVYGKSSIKKTGLYDRIVKLLKAEDINIFELGGIDPNPRIESIREGSDICKKHNIDLVLGVGGGSVIDMAKLISVFAHQSGDIENYVLGNKKISDKKTPLLAIPTTAGSGAEATHFSVLYIDKNKYSVACNALLPNYVYLTSEFSKNAGPYLTACAGIDAFSQAIESVWSVLGNNESVGYALEAISIIWDNLHKAVHQNSTGAKKQMAIASNLAGKAINISKTTAPHALSYSFTSYYSIPHGHAVALSLPFFFSYNANVCEQDCIDRRGADNVRKRIDDILKIIDVELIDAERTLTAFIESLGLKMKIGELVSNFEPRLLIENINIERLKNNPREVTESTISDYIEKCYA